MKILPYDSSYDNQIKAIHRGNCMELLYHGDVI